MSDIVWIGLLASLGAGLMTGVGALPVLAGRHPSARRSDAMLGFAAGVMLSASYFSLILPGLAAAEAQGLGRPAAAGLAAVGIALGALFVAGLNRALPHEHFVAGREGAGAEGVARIWLFVLAITIHNFPEGLAVGVGFGGGDVANGMTLAIGIGLQNAPEGLAVAVALVGLGYSRLFAVAIAAATGLVEPVGGLIGVIAVHASGAVLPWGLTFAAGAMLFIVSHEIIPETHRRGHQAAATTGLMVGVIAMMLLDVTLG
ncbi:ZIP family metal transporter [Palleronia sp. KMU-117]|uniref:ZIP family metal transporter n=1 Tax=Palleronia sp. KMU-117 TaxID=3434108 RepID=UPI003D730106